LEGRREVGGPDPLADMRREDGEEEVGGTIGGRRGLGRGGGG